MYLIDDVFDLVTEVIRKNRYAENVECNIARERGDAITDEDFIYNLPETPDFLLKNRLMKIISTEYFFSPRNNLTLNDEDRKLDYFIFPSNRSSDLKGLMAVNFDMKKLREWRKKERDNRLKSSLAVSYDFDKDNLVVGSMTIHYYKDKFNTLLLRFLFKTKKNKSTELSWDQVIDNIEKPRSELDKKGTTRVYSACEGINSRVAKETGVNDLLIFSKLAVRLNPKYI